MGQVIFKRIFLIIFLLIVFLFLSFPHSASAYTGGYVFPISAKWGETVDFHLSTNASKATLEIFRQGVTQEKIAEIKNLTGTYLPCEHHSEVGCFFPKAYSVTLDENFRPGLYLAKFINQDNLSEEDLSYFVVKPNIAGSYSKIAVVLPINTWEVHNYREGSKVYPSPYEPGYEGRARTGSFLRPWLGICSNLELGYPLGNAADIWWLESQGYFPEYLTDVDLDKEQNILSNYRVGISLAHHEYWSWGMRDAVENFVNNGGNFLFLSGNVSWWQVRYEDDHSLIRVYKLKEEDPYYLDNDPSNDHLVTVNWKSEPVNRPETIMTGTSFAYSGFWNPTNEPYNTTYPGFTVYRTNDPKWNWIYEGTGLKDGDVIGKAMFQSMVETDGTHFIYDKSGLPVVSDTNTTKTPSNFTILGVSQTTHWGASTGHAVMGIRETEKGGIVFTGSQQYFSAGLTDRDPAVEKMILNLLARMVPGERKEKKSLPYSSGGLKVIDFAQSQSNGEVEVKLESDLCSLNSGKGDYWIWVLTDTASDSGSFNYSFADQSGWFSLKGSASNPWTQLTDSATGFSKQFNLNYQNLYKFKFWPRLTAAKIKKIIFTNTSFFYPARFQFENQSTSPLSLPVQEVSLPQTKLLFIPANKDSYLDSWSTQTNYGTSSLLKVKNDNVYKSLINFDLSLLTSGTKLNRAFVKLYLTQNSNNTPVNVGLMPLVKNWSEKEVTWQQAEKSVVWGGPGLAAGKDYNDSFIIKERVGNIGQWYYFDVTSLIKPYLNNPPELKGFLISAVGNNPVTTILSFTSREYPNSSFRPVLELNYDTSGGPVATPTAVLTPTLSPTTIPSPTLTLSPTPSATPSGCQPAGGKVSLFYQDGSIWVKPLDTNWNPNYGQVFKVNENVKVEEIKIKVKNDGNGQKQSTIALTLEEGKKIENSQPAAALAFKNITIPGYQFQGWISFPFSQDNLILNQQTNYFLWIKDPNGYIAYSWAKGSLEIIGEKCQEERTTPSLTPTVTPTTIPPTILPTPGAEVTITFQQGANGYNGTKDTYFYLYNSNNYCSSTALKVGYKQQNASLLYFDLSSVASGSSVSSAKLQLYAVGWGGSDITLNFYMVLRSWNDCQATAQKADSTVNWQSFGCSDVITDREAVPKANFITSGVPKWYEINLTSLVQEWISNSANNKGLLIKGSLGENSLFYFSSSEGDIANRPKLIVTYR